MTECILSNLRLVLAEEVIHGHIVLDGDRIRAIGSGPVRSPAAQDCAGDWLLPGFVEVHTDNLEKHLLPRPGVSFPAAAAVQAHDAQLLAAGITTACDALAVGDVEPGSVRIRTVQAAYAALREAREAGVLRCAHYLHLRAELPCPELLQMLQSLMDDPTLRLVSLTDHTPGQRQFRDMQRYLTYYGQDAANFPGGVPALLAARRAQQTRYRHAHRDAVLRMAQARAVPVASHDDTEPADIEEALACGAGTSEFPTTLEAARAARDAGLCIVAGAPNLVLGGSHSGNVAALDLARAGCLDVLSSDYVPASLLPALTVLNEHVGWTWPQAVAAVSRAPARALGLHDRGVVAEGMRADLLRVRGATPSHISEVWIAGRRLLAH
ncbi:alpha-D-ribose 1-methylphosphonate 5-triphosphate diphosphatase [Stenotrophomonas sp. SY1]|uniref:alpha-D-ribose 1-methylphosphonate 5-triphosphate diphosphatase n=1 Tax=Stenotrophomonas sp. SY1 TaxID=477235 RepID=UPI001E51739C|nr:alpha-D-ribose 1-methylphosphonate 5-triphosphate diphosphatase [Stenotrophomonas sp. SY1]MCD9086364.1 alpha-D-ribose 1-methylphosphonate 5-triphosphate diphosphatase [Stenotrophomonas sp. SY1]